jgi:hypothetical protein
MIAAWDRLLPLPPVWGTLGRGELELELELELERDRDMIRDVRRGEGTKVTGGE